MYLFRTIPILFSLFFFAISLNVSDASFLFGKNLRLGEQSVDVYNLQKRLNSDSRTAVALSGPGSLGNETYYFGNLTHSAVIRFQELYRNEVLTPVGLYSGTGFVGPSTRSLLNLQLTQTTTKTPTPTPTTAPKVSETPKKPSISSINPIKGQNNTEITITGEGFEEKNTVVTTYGKFENIPSFDGKTIKVRIDFEIFRDIFLFDTAGDTSSGGGTFSDDELIEGVPFQGSSSIEAPVAISVLNSLGESNIIMFHIVSGQI